MRRVRKRVLSACLAREMEQSFVEGRALTKCWVVEWKLKKNKGQKVFCQFICPEKKVIARLVVRGQTFSRVKQTWRKIRRKNKCAGETREACFAERKMVPKIGQEKNISSHLGLCSDKERVEFVMKGK